MAEKQAEFINLIQFSDTHLFKDTKGTLCGQNTQESLDAVMRLAQMNGWPPDFVLVTGDISQDMSKESYVRFREQFSKLNLPVYCLPGNHDEPKVMTAVLNQEPVVVGRNVLWGPWQIIMLDSSIPGENGGAINPQELLFLKDSLKKHPDKHVIISMHHSPVPLDSQWIDTMVINNAGEFFDVVDQHSHVRAILWGHIHQVYENERSQVKLMGSPSTSIQFKPKSNEFRFDSEGPGYRWMRLYKDGRIESGIQRVKDFKSTIDLSATGIEEAKMSDTTKQLKVSGRVQGVGFRYSLCDEAIRNGLTGWVKNMPDGTVEAMVSGSNEKLSAIIDWVKKGPGLAQVEKVDVADSSGEFQEFEIRY